MRYIEVMLQITRSSDNFLFCNNYVLMLKILFNKASKIHFTLLYVSIRMIVTFFMA